MIPSKRSDPMFTGRCVIEERRDEPRMRMHHAFFARAVARPHDADTVVDSATRTDACSSRSRSTTTVRIGPQRGTTRLAGGYVAVRRHGGLGGGAADQLAKDTPASGMAARATRTAATASTSSRPDDTPAAGSPCNWPGVVGTDTAPVGRFVRLHLDSNNAGEVASPLSSSERRWIGRVRVRFGRLSIP